LNENNPFLEMIAAIDGTDEQQPPPPPPQGAAAAQNIDNNGTGRVKLPDFWPHAPGIWFARAELRFEVSNVIHERQKFAYTVDALPYETLCQKAQWRDDGRFRDVFRFYWDLLWVRQDYLLLLFCYTVTSTAVSKA
jgi:hypothetical protein